MVLVLILIIVLATTRIAFWIKQHNQTNCIIPPKTETVQVKMFVTVVDNQRHFVSYSQAISGLFRYTEHEDFESMIYEYYSSSIQGTVYEYTKSCDMTKFMWRVSEFRTTEQKAITGYKILLTKTELDSAFIANNF